MTIRLLSAYNYSVLLGSIVKTSFLSKCQDFGETCVFKAQYALNLQDRCRVVLICSVKQGEKPLVKLPTPDKKANFSKILKNAFSLT